MAIILLNGFVQVKQEIHCFDLFQEMKLEKVPNLLVFKQGLYSTFEGVFPGTFSSFHGCQERGGGGIIRPSTFSTHGAMPHCHDFSDALPLNIIQAGTEVREPMLLS